MRILLIDDDALTRQLGERLLRQHGWDVVCADTMLTAREILVHDPLPNVILLDLIMQDEGDNIASIRELSVSAPVIVLTGDESEEVEEECFRNGADDFIPKSLAFGTLNSIYGLIRLKGRIRASVKRRKYAGQNH